MIPKKIHYCWFGGDRKPKLAKKCIASWHTLMPDYEIIEWNEDNFDVNFNAYTRMCYEQRKFAFLSDYVRLLMVEKHGGIYFDTDVEAVRPFDDLLTIPAFFGFENSSYVSTGLGFGGEPHSPVVCQMLEEYVPFLDGQHGVQGCPQLNTQALVKLGLQLNGKKQVLDDGVVFPEDYFNPRNSVTGELKKTKKTYSIHWYMGSCLTRQQILRSKISRPFHRIFGMDCFRKMK